MRTVGLVSVARSDYGIYLPLLRRLKVDEGLRYHLIVSGMHLSPEFGMTVRVIEEDGFEIGDRIEMLLSSDSSAGIAKSIGLGIIGFAQSFSMIRPDILVVSGDRFEMYSAALAALPFKIPVAHLHGGELTLGAIDDSLRHSLTKLSHLHFVSTDEYGKRVIQMGEEPWRVTVCGAPSLENLQTINLLSVEELESRYGFSLARAPVLVTFHPVTLEFEDTEKQVCELLAGLQDLDLPLIFSAPNADTQGRTVMRLFQEFVRNSSSAWISSSLGTQVYFSLMALSAVMIGNSSSGIIEAASFKLPVVNIGTRQGGRVKPRNVIDVACDRRAIREGIRKALDPAFIQGLQDLTNPYDHGAASCTILEQLKAVTLDDRLLVKHFHEVHSMG